MEKRAKDLAATPSVLKCRWESFKKHHAIKSCRKHTSPAENDLYLDFSSRSDKNSSESREKRTSLIDFLLKNIFAGALT